MYDSYQHRLHDIFREHLSMLLWQQLSTHDPNPAVSMVAKVKKSQKATAEDEDITLLSEESVY